jgi:hypothetical protein
MVAASAGAETGITEVDGTDPGHVQFPVSEAAVYSRPFAPAQKVLRLEDYYVHDLTNQKAFDVRASRQGDGTTWAYRDVVIDGARVERVNRDESAHPMARGLHIDYFRFAGGPNQDVLTNVVLSDVVIRDGDALPVLFTDGFYDTITLRNVSIAGTTVGNVQFKTDNMGSIRRIVVEDSPGLKLALMGRPGTVGEVVFADSPGASVGDLMTAWGRTGARVSFADGGGVPDAPEPGTGLLAAGAAVLLSRRRK